MSRDLSLNEMEEVFRKVAKQLKIPTFAVKERIARIIQERQEAELDARLTFMIDEEIRKKAATKPKTEQGKT